MPSPFESVARVAIDEIIKKHLVASKYGHFLTDDGLRDLSDELFEFLQTSRNLKTVGDRVLAGQLPHADAGKRLRT